jgi:hypothetical protein
MPATYRRSIAQASGVFTLRYDSKLRHIGLGTENAGTRIPALYADRYIRVVDAETGELLREHLPTVSRDIGRVEPRGLEPLTPCLQSRCATNCAKAPSGEPVW